MTRFLMISVAAAAIGLGAAAVAQGGDANAMRHLAAFNGLVGGLPARELSSTLAAELQTAGVAGSADAAATLLQQELPHREDGGAEARLGGVPPLIGVSRFEEDQRWLGSETSRKRSS